MFQAVDKSFFLTSCFLVCIWKWEQEYQYEEYEVDDSTSEEQMVVGSKSCSCCSYGCTEYEWKQHLGDRDEEFNSHGCNARSFVDDLGNCRIDTSVKE